jgi:hypothetical protein
VVFFYPIEEKRQENYPPPTPDGVGPPPYWAKPNRDEKLSQFFKYFTPREAFDIWHFYNRHEVPFNFPLAISHFPFSILKSDNKLKTCCRFRF